MKETRQFENKEQLARKEPEHFRASSKPTKEFQQKEQTETPLRLEKFSTRSKPLNRD